MAQRKRKRTRSGARSDKRASAATRHAAALDATARGTRPPADSRPPADHPAPVEKGTPTDTGTPADTRTPDDTRTPAATGTPTDTRTPDDTRTPAATGTRTSGATRPRGTDPRPRATPRASRAGWRMERPLSRSERRNAEVRAGLTPLKPGERPWPIVVSAVAAAVVGLGNLIAFAAGVKVGGKHPSAVGVVVFSVLMLVTAGGLWRMWYGAVLGFMALMAIICVVFALLLIEASNVLGAVVAVAVIAGAGFLLYKLIRVLSRIQIPPYPRR